MSKHLILFFATLVLCSCSTDKLDKKGFQVSEIVEDDAGEKIVGLAIDSLQLATQPRNVLSTFHPEHRLTPIYKVNYNKRNGHFWGYNNFYSSWGRKLREGNNWNYNFMPGFSAVYGYNMVNVSHFNNRTKTEKKLFDRPVLIRTLYYPAATKDTLNFEPVSRNYYIVSVYDEDTNHDGFINVNDLRRLYLFNLEGEKNQPLIPKSYNVTNSEYDPANDFMYIFARKDQNNNGQLEQEEPTEIFWIDLKNPNKTGRQYHE
ncbi:MAG: hypothetical protein ACK5L5_12205 [Bacteroidales bacterium]